MKRAFYEWGAIGTFALAISCFGYWGVSKITAAADSQMSFVWRAVDASVSNGTVTLADQINNGEVIDAIEKSLTFVPPLDVTGKYRLSLPGFELHFITFGNDSPSWRIEFSLLIPASIFMLCAAYAIVRYRKVRRAMELAEKPAVSSEPVTHPLD